MADILSASKKSMKYFTSIFLNLFIIHVGLCQTLTQVTDIDGNMYETVEIGKQIWFKENLRTTRLNDGKKIAYVSSDSLWESVKNPAMCWYNNDTSDIHNFGAYYNWYAASNDKLCPSGWRVSTKGDWENLIAFIGGAVGTSGKLKLQDVWKKFGEVRETNESGFSAIPAGDRYTNGRFVNAEEYAYWWTTTTIFSNQSWGFSLEYGTNHVLSHYYEREIGFSIRCVKE